MPIIRPETINVEKFIRYIKDIRCWVKYFYKESEIPELTRIKALQRCINFLIRIYKITWKDYF